MSSVTIVSAFYPFEKSKHSMQEYAAWIFNFLSNVNTPIVMFSEQPFCDLMREMRESAGLSDKLYMIDKPFSEVKFSSTEWIKIWEEQLKIDPLAHLHGQELFRVWANKPFFVEEAIQLNPFHSDKFVWCDAGCWRDPTVAKVCGPHWPSPEKISPGRMHIITVNTMKPFLEKITKKGNWTHSSGLTHEDIVKNINVRDNAIVGGTILLGDKDAWIRWIPAFEASLNFYIQNNLFAGDDQAVIVSTILWLRYSNTDASPILYQAPKRNHFFVFNNVHMGDQWFAFQQHFSRHDFTLEMY